MNYETKLFTFNKQLIKYLLLFSALVSNAIFAAGYGEKQDADIANVPSGTYVLEPYHGHLTFKYMHSGWSYPSVKFDKFDLTVELDHNDLASSTASMIIDASSINAGAKIFNGHLDKAYFQSTEYPQITISAKGYDSTGPATGKMSADMTIVGISHPIELDVVINAAGTHPHPMAGKAPGMGVSITATVNGQLWFPEARFPAPEEVTINLEAELISEEGGKNLAAAFEKLWGPRQ